MPRHAGPYAAGDWWQWPQAELNLPPPQLGQMVVCLPGRRWAVPVWAATVGPRGRVSGIWVDHWDGTLWVRVSGRASI
jgi:hypothetical protein